MTLEAQIVECHDRGFTRAETIGRVGCTRQYVSMIGLQRCGGLWPCETCGAPSRLRECVTCQAERKAKQKLRPPARACADCGATITDRKAWAATICMPCKRHRATVSVGHIYRRHLKATQAKAYNGDMKWTPEEDALAIDCPGADLLTLCKKLARTYSAVQQRRVKLHRARQVAA